MTEFQARVRAVLLALKPGDVMTYGEIAAEAGYPGAARAVGNYLGKTDGVPWWRVLAAGGRPASRCREEQLHRLAAEGLIVRNGRVLPQAGTANARP